MKHHATDWKPFITLGALFAAIALVFILKLNYFWLFVIAMIACHWGHQSMTKGRGH